MRSRRLILNTLGKAKDSEVLWLQAASVRAHPLQVFLTTEVSHDVEAPHLSGLWARHVPLVEGEGDFQRPKILTYVGPNFDLCRIGRTVVIWAIEAHEVELVGANARLLIPIWMKLLRSRSVSSISSMISSDQKPSLLCRRQWDSEAR